MNQDTCPTIRSHRYIQFVVMFFSACWLIEVQAAWLESLEQKIEQVQQSSSQMLDEAVEKSRTAWKDFWYEDPEIIKQRERDARFREIWNQMIPKLDAAVTIAEQRELAPDSAIFSKDKTDFDLEYQEIMDSIVVILDGTNLLKYQQRVAMLKERIDETNAEISRLQEARLGAPSSGLFKTTKSDYNDQIDELMVQIVDYQETITETEKEFVNELNQFGIELNFEQVQVLLARVDANNILQMTVVFDTLKALTLQLMEIMSTSGENVDYVRYYGMHVVLLELALYMQDRYINDINVLYLPKLEEIIHRTRIINKESIRALRQEKSAERRRVYKSNILAHQLTLNTARIYMQHIQTQRNKVLEVRDKISRDLALARNTYETVSVSSELLTILQVSQSSFDALMHLQVPEIVPFEDNQMLKKFEEISSVISKSE